MRKVFNVNGANTADSSTSDKSVTHFQRYVWELARTTGPTDAYRVRLRHVMALATWQLWTVYDWAVTENDDDDNNWRMQWIKCRQTHAYTFGSKRYHYICIFISPESFRQTGTTENGWFQTSLGISTLHEVIICPPVLLSEVGNFYCAAWNADAV